MPRRKKDKVPGIHPMHNISRPASKRRDSEGSRDEIYFSDDDGSVIKNWFATGDDVDPFESLKSIQEMFRGKIDPDVVSMVFSECAFNVDQALESLFALASENIPEELKQDNELPSSTNNHDFSKSEPPGDSKSYREHPDDSKSCRDRNITTLDAKINENKNIENAVDQTDISLAEVHYSENDTLIKGAACRSCSKLPLEFDSHNIMKGGNSEAILGSTSQGRPLSNEELQVHDSNDQNLANANDLSRCSIQHPSNQCKPQFLNQFLVPTVDYWMAENMLQNVGLDNNFQHVNIGQLHEENKLQCKRNNDSSKTQSASQHKKNIFSPPAFLNKLTCPAPYLPLGSNNQKMQSEMQFFPAGSTPQFITPIVPTTMLRKTVANTSLSLAHPSNISLLSEPSYSTAVTHPESNKQTERRIKIPERSESVDGMEELKYGLLESTLKLFQPKEHVVCLIKQGCKVLVIMRGLPGSGKSTLAREIQYSGVVLSTDDYFHKGGKYKYDLSKLSDAHEWNKRRTKKAMSKGKTPIIIDNTNVESWEIKPYVAMGLKYGYNIEILEPDTKWKFNPSQLAKKNVHNVSQGKIEYMLQKYEHKVTVHKIIQSLSEHSLKESSPSKVKSERSSVDKSPEKTLPEHETNEIIAEPSQSEKNILNMPEEKSSTVFLEAVVHQEEHESENLSENILPQDKAAQLTTYSDDQDNEVFDFNDIDNKKMDLQDLMALLQQDSEESLSPSRHTSTSCSSQDMSGWEAITEHDDDFLWSESSAGRRGSTTLNTKILEEEEDSDSENENLDNLETAEYSTVNYTSEDFTTVDVSPKCAPEVIKPLSSDGDENACMNTNTQDVLKNNILEPLSAWQAHSQGSERLCPEDSWKCSDTDISKPEEDFQDPKPQRMQSSYIFKKQPATCSVEMNHESNSFVSSDSMYVSSEDDFKDDNLMWSDTEGDKNKLNWDNSDENEDNKQLNLESSDKPKPQRTQVLGKKEKETLCFNFHKFSPVLSSLDGHDANSQKAQPAISKDKEIVKLKQVFPPCRKKIAACFDIKENSSCLQKDWEFPKFPCENNNEDIFSEAPHVEYLEKETQTDLSEFVVLRKLQANQSIPTDICILPARTELKMNNEVTSCNSDNFIKKSKIAQFDKSTSTNDIPEEMEIGEKLKFLQTCFPSLSGDDLKDIYEKCHGDHLWAADILLDLNLESYVSRQQSGEGNCDTQSVSLENELSFKSSESVDADISESLVEMNAPCQAVEDVKYSAIVNEEESQKNVNPDIINKTSSANTSGVSDIENYEIDNVSTISTNKSPLLSSYNSENDQFTTANLKLVLDPTFAKQLEAQFGPVGFSISPDSLNTDDLTVPINFEIARMIHESWSKSLKMKFEKEELEMNKMIKLGTSNSDITADAYLKSLLDKPVKNNVFSQVTCQPQSLIDDKSARNNIKLKEHDKVMPLSEIMNMEAALELSRKEMEKSCNMDLSTRMKLQRLYEMFPGIDKIALYEVFDANNYSLPKSIACIEQTTGFPGISLNAKEQEELEQEFLELAKQESLQFNHEWQDWITFDDEPVLPCPNAISCDDLRSEATMHYQLRYECFQKAQEAYSRGLPAVASFYSQQGNIHMKKLQEANKRASERILEIRNASSDPMVLDLHGLYVKEALRAIRNFLAERKTELKNSTSHQWVLSVITGRGTHSMQGVPKLRPAITEYLKRQGYSFEESSEGVFKITLT